MYITNRSAASLHSRTNWSGKRTNLQATRRIRKSLACGSWFTNSSRVLPTSCVVYQPINHRILWSIAEIMCLRYKSPTSGKADNQTTWKSLKASVNWPKVRAEDSASLDKFFTFLMRCNNAMECSKYLTKLEQPDIIQKLVMKLPLNLRKTWRRWSLKL